MSVILSDNIQQNAPKLLDNRSGKFVAGVWTPYSSVAEANATIPSAYRAQGLIVYILEGGFLQEYWYRAGIADTDLVPKTSDLVDSFTLTADNNRSIPLGQTIVLIEIKSNVDMTINIGTLASVTYTDIKDSYVLPANETRYIEYIKKADTAFSIYFGNLTAGGNLYVKLIKKLY